MAADKQVDLFLETMINAPLKDDRALMEFPFFSLQKQPRTEPLIYDDGRIKIEVLPGAKGIATIWDKDVLIYCASLINERIERGLPVDRKVRFNVYDLLRVTGRGTGPQAYALFRDAIFRLRSTSITTTIESAGQRDRIGFGWIADFHIIERDSPRGDGKKVMVGCELTLNDWMFRAIVNDRRVLTINRDYFQLGKGLERRLYELGRKHCGRQERWTIRLARLAEKCGSTQELRYFKRDLKTIIEADTIPDYQLSMGFDPQNAKAQEADGYDTRRFGGNDRVIVVFTPRETVDNSSALNE